MILPRLATSDMGVGDEVKDAGVGRAEGVRAMDGMDGMRDGWVKQLIGRLSR